MIEPLPNRGGPDQKLFAFVQGGEGIQFNEGSEFLDLRYKGRRLFEIVYIDDFKLEVNERICSRYVEVGQLEDALVLFQARDFDGGLRALKFIFHG